VDEREENRGEKDTGISGILKIGEREPKRHRDSEDFGD
jgi:hypothetical protein